MSFKSVIVLISFIYCSCNNKKQELSPTQINIPSFGNSLMLVYDTLFINKYLDSVVSVFNKENSCDSCIHEIFIDKVMPYKAIITLRSRAFSAEYLKESNPLFFLKYDGVAFYLYTGIEEVFTGQKSILNFRDVAGPGKMNYNSWNIFIDSGKYEIIKKDVGIPFYQASPAKITVKEN